MIRPALVKLILAAALFAPLAAWASQPVFSLRGGDYAALPDPGQSLSVEQLQQPHWAGRFELRRFSPGFGVQADGMWLRFRLPPAVPREDTLLLSDFGGYQKFCVYWPVGTAGFQADCRVGADDYRGHSYRGPGYLLKPPPGLRSDRDIYAYAQSEIWLVMSIVYGSADAVLEHLARQQTLYGLFYGMMLTVVVLSLALAGLRRDDLLVWFGGMLAAIVVLLACWENRLTMVLPQPVWTIHLVVPMILLAIIMGSHLLSAFLETRLHQPGFDRALRWSSRIALGLVPAYLLWPGVGIILVAAALMIIAPILLATAWQRLRQGFPPAGYALASILLLMAAAFAGGLEAFGILIADPQSLSLSRYIGVLVLTGCLVLGIIDRFSALAGERDEAQKLAASAQQLALRRAHYDPVTGLARRERLLELLQEGIISRSGSGQGLALVQIGFVQLRRLLRGHDPATTEEIIVELARRLRRILPPDVPVASLGQGEYAWIDSGDEQQLRERCARLQKLLAEPLMMAGEHRPSSVFGVARFPEHGHEARALAQAAEIALTRARRPLAAWLTAYSKDMRHSEKLAMQTLSRFDTALLEGALQMHYQPFVSLQNGEVLGAEALLRWPDSAGGYHNNGQYMPLVEQGESMPALTSWTAQTVAAQIGAWDKRGLQLPYVTMNFCSRQLQQHNFLELLVQAMDENQVAGARLGVEVTEGSLLEDLQAAGQTLTALRRRGVRIAVDDFGVGYSSLSYLRQLPLDVLKIDQSFLSGVPDDPGAGAVFVGIASLARSLGLNIVSEGVEEQKQAEFLQQTGVQMAQGFLYSKALAANDFAVWCEQRASNSAVPARL